MALFDTPRLGASGVTGGYEVSHSLRFNHPDNTYLVYQPSSDGNRQKWTWSGWVKRVRLGSTTYGLFTSQNNGDGGGNNGIASIYFGSDDKIHTYYDTTSGDNYGAINDARYRDINAWYHIVWQVDAANSTSKIFVNGVSQTIASGSQPISGYSYTMNQSGKRMTYGIDAWDLGTPASIYVAECHYSDGQLYDADVFAETDSETGQWVPKQNPAITYGTNGHYLNFSDNSSVSALGTDSSGQGNNFTVNNLVVSSGIGNDSMKDTPTNNFATFNRNLPIASSASYGNGNLEFSTSSSGQKQTTSTFAHDSGKWYAEFRLDSYSFSSGSYPYIGVIASDRFNQSWVGELGTAVNTLGTAYNNSSVISGGFSYTAGDIIGLALDVDNLLVYFYKNGTIQNSGNGYAITARPGKGYQFSASLYAGSGKWAANFGQIGVGSNSDANGHGNFTYSVPSGYLAECSANLDDPTIALPTDHFNIVTWSGNNSSGRTITGLGFQPNWVWIKCRSDSASHQLYDTVRGVNKRLATNNTAAEVDQDEYGYLSAFATDGFTLTNGSNGSYPAGSVNMSGRTYVGWSWYAPTSFSNSAGVNTATLASSGTVNTTAGFSIVSYTGNATASTKIYHGLNAVPKWILIKRLTGDNWISYHAGSNDSNQDDYYYEFQNTDSRKGPNSNYMWSSIAPDSNIFGVFSDSAVNGNGMPFIAYVFAEVAGYSRFGHYTGNGDSDGMFINLGFRPALIIVKANDGEPWVMFDDKRPEQNPATKRIRANESSSEDDASGRYKDFYANGFKARGTSGEQNSNGQRYIYMAWAKSPFKYARAR